MVLDEVLGASDGARLLVAVVGVGRGSDSCCGVGSVGYLYGSVYVFLIVDRGYPLLWTTREIGLLVSNHLLFLSCLYKVYFG